MNVVKEGNMNGIIRSVKKNNNELIELSVCLDELFRIVAGQKA